MDDERKKYRAMTVDEIVEPMPEVVTEGFETLGRKVVSVFAGSQDALLALSIMALVMEAISAAPRPHLAFEQVMAGMASDVLVPTIRAEADALITRDTKVRWADSIAEAAAWLGEFGKFVEIVTEEDDWGRGT